MQSWRLYIAFRFSFFTGQNCTCFIIKEKISLYKATRSGLNSGGWPTRNKLNSSTHGNNIRAFSRRLIACMYRDKRELMLRILGGGGDPWRAQCGLHAITRYLVLWPSLGINKSKTWNICSRQNTVRWHNLLQLQHFRHERSWEQKCYWTYIQRLNYMVRKCYQKISNWIEYTIICGHYRQKPYNSFRFYVWIYVRRHLEVT
jgi:hypothetical protein